MGKKLQRPTIHYLLANPKMMAGILLLSSAESEDDGWYTAALFC
jgi:hypothetical protein